MPGDRVPIGDTSPLAKALERKKLLVDVWKNVALLLGEKARRTQRLHLHTLVPFSVDSAARDGNNARNLRVPLVFAVPLNQTDIDRLLHALIRFILFRLFFSF